MNKLGQVPFLPLSTGGEALLAVSAGNRTECGALSLPRQEFHLLRNQGSTDAKL